MKNNNSNNLEPFIWTGEQIINATTSIPSCELPLWDVLFSAKALLAVVVNIEDIVVNLFTMLLGGNNIIICDIIVCLCTSSLINQRNLNELDKLEKEYKTRLKINVLVVNNRENILASIYCVKSLEDKTLLSLGSFLTDLNNYILDKNKLKRTNLVFEPEPNLLEVFYRWFEQIKLENTIFLHKVLLDMFNNSLILEKDKEDSKQENTHVDKSNFEENVYNLSINSTVEESKGINKIEEIEEQNNLFSIKQMGFYRPDPFVLEIDRIYKLGEIVTLDKKNRILPLDVPIKAEWLGLRSTEKIGEITQEIKYSIAAVDKEFLKIIENKKNEIRYLINNFTFSMGENLHWIPLNAKPIFEKELDRINNESKDIINSIIGNNIEEYLNKRKNRIKEDAKTIRRRFLKNIKEQQEFLFFETKQKSLSAELELSDEITVDEINIDKIVSEISKRLKKAKDAKFVPTVIYNKINFNHKESNWTSSWTQVLHFLTNVAEFSRKGTYERFLKQTPSVIEEKYLQAMNVCGDFVFELKEEKDFIEQRKRALSKLNSLLKVELGKQLNLFNLFETDEDRCKALFCLIIDNN